MDLTRTAFSRMIRVALTVLAVLIVVGYAIFRSLPYFEGPSIAIFQPVDGSSVSTSTATIIGRATRVASISLDGMPISIDEHGDFKRTIIVFPGVNRIVVEATDQFKRTTERTLSIYGAF